MREIWSGGRVGVLARVGRECVGYDIVVFGARSRLLVLCLSSDWNRACRVSAEDCSSLQLIECV